MVKLFSFEFGEQGQPAIDSFDPSLTLLVSGLKYLMYFE